MGINATILVVSKAPPPVGLKAEKAAWAEPYVTGNWWDGGVAGLDVNEGEAVYSVDTDLERYFSAGYPRGNWPYIRSLIEGAQLGWPGARVYYGGDSEFVQEATPELLAEIDEVWKATGREPALA